MLAIKSLFAGMDVVQNPRKGSFALGIPCLTVGTFRLAGLAATFHDLSTTGVAGKCGGVLGARHPQSMFAVGKFLFHLIITENILEEAQPIAAKAFQRASLLNHKLKNLPRDCGFHMAAGKLNTCDGEQAIAA
jgi:hypothetical protein